MLYFKHIILFKTSDSKVSAYCENNSPYKVGLVVKSKTDNIDACSSFR